MSVKIILVRLTIFFIVPPGICIFIRRFLTRLFRIIFQAKTSVTPEDTPAEVEEKIHMLESRHFPRVIAETFFK